jgi:hypothetical protein
MKGRRGMCGHRRMTADANAQIIMLHFHFAKTQPIGDFTNLFDQCGINAPSWRARRLMNRSWLFRAWR